MERCPNCGCKLSSIDVLCPKCGTVVEVIQTNNDVVPAKSITPSSSETIKVNNTKAPETAQKKDIPKYFNVYYEGLPEEDSEDSEEGSEIETVLENPPSEENERFDQPEVYSQPNSIRARIEMSEPEDDKKEDKNQNGLFNEIITAKANEDADNDYSPRYLENLKNLNLPEIDDISNFDPEEYMREYKYKKILGNQAAQGDSQTAKKQWLEIEETDNNLNSELTKVRDDVQKQADQPIIIERRYRGTQDSRTEKRRDSTERRQDNTEKRRDSIERKQDIPREEKDQIPVRNKKRKSSAPLMIFFWMIISVAILFSCVFFHNLIRSSYASYDDFIFSITNRVVDLDPGKP